MASKLGYPLFLFIVLFISCQKERDHQVETDFFGAVSTATPEATKAGEEILKKGGNAIDAAVAVSFVLGVTEPAMSGIGGGTQMLVGLKGREPFMINGTTFSPKATPTEWDKDALTYHKRSTIPSTVKTLYYSWQKYGSGLLTWEELLDPAIEFAAEGFVMGEFRSKVYERYEERLQNSPHNAHFLLMPDGRAPTVGDTLRQPLLAETLRNIARGGENIFYQGEIARKIARDMQTNGGWINLEDLQSFGDPIEIPALKTTYHGYEVYTSAPPCGGWVMLLALNAMESLEATAYPDSLQSAFRTIGALKLAHNDRLARPVENHVNFWEEVSLKLDKSYPQAILETASHEGREEGGETTHFSLVDKDGTVVTVTASINAYFGARAASPELGFMYNTYMNDFEFDDPAHAWAVGPGKMAYSSMTPTIVRRKGENVMALGSPGSARIISAVAQVISYWANEDQDLDQAIKKPRFHVNRDRLYVENPEDRERLATIIDHLDLRLIDVSADLGINGLNAYFGGVHAVAFEKGKWVGAADPRRDGKATISGGL